MSLARTLMAGPTTVTSPAYVAALPAEQTNPSQVERSPGPGPTVSTQTPLQPAPNSSATADTSTARSQPIPRNPRKAVPSSRRISGIFPGNASPISDRSAQTSLDGRESILSRVPPLGIIGICALDSKARSKPSRNILNKINANQEFEVIIFGDKVILDEAPENWPLCDYLISFFSDGFPLDKAIAYVRLRKPFCVNDLPMQMVLWDRRICLKILDQFDVPTPDRVEVSRDGGPILPSPDVARHVFERTGIKVRGPDEGASNVQPSPSQVVMLDDDTLSVDGVEMKKPFVEKPVSGENHNINIYYSKEDGGGGRRLFRKINNKSSEADETLNIPRAVTDPESSYIFEKFLSTDDNEDVKAYTVGPSFCHAETRKSPTVDGIVKRNTHGKEMRYVTSLSAEESRIAARISEAFGQRVCGFDLLRIGGNSFVIDVNGWSFVKDNNSYYDECAKRLKRLFVEEKSRKEGKMPSSDGDVPADFHQRPSTGQFSTAFKNMLKSPSMSRLAGYHYQAHRAHGRASPDLIGQTTQLVSPSSLERPAPTHLPSPLLGQPEALPPPAVEGPSVSDSALPESGMAEQGGTHVPAPASKAQWKLKGMVAVIRHADRTPKQKFKFTFHSKHFVELLKGHREEVLLNTEASLNSVMEAVKLALQEGEEDPDKLKLLRTSLARKGSWPGTKVQIKPMFRKKKNPMAQTTGQIPTGTDDSTVDGSQNSITIATEDETGKPKNEHRTSLADVTLSREAAKEDNLELEKLQLIIKWGGEPTHSARYQAQELGENMRNDLLLMNRDALEDLNVYSSSERRVTTSAHIWTSAFLDRQDIPPDYVQIRKALLDDSNAAKDEMDKVKKKLKGLLREGKKAPGQFTWPENMAEPYIVVRRVVVLMQFHRDIMRYNFTKLYGGATSSLAAAIKNPAPKVNSSNPINALSQAEAVNRVQGRWCCGEDADLFKERWEKLFAEFCDPEKVDPSKISELHDTMKFDAIHNRPFLEWVFTAPPSMLDAFNATESSVEDKTKARPRGESFASTTGSPEVEPGGSKRPISKSLVDKPNTQNIAERMGFRRRTEQPDAGVLRNNLAGTGSEQYFKLYTGGTSKSSNQQGLEKLRELFNYAKILFDYIGPQEYGIKDAEKLEIGLLTSLPLLRAIVNDLEDMQASEGAKSSVYFTKESHIYTLLNCVIEGGIETKIERNKIPELDYLSTICFELYESQNSLHDETDEAFNYSIRITISPGCHAFEPLDVQLDSKHCIGFAPRRSLTAHNDWKHVIETLRAKFHTVKLPKSFVAVNLAEKAPQAFEVSSNIQSSGNDDNAPVGPESIGGEILKIRSSRPGFSHEAAGVDYAALGGVDVDGAADLETSLISAPSKSEDDSAQTDIKRDNQSSGTT